MTGKAKIFFSIVAILAILLSLNVTSAQAKKPTYVNYVVRRGDTLGGIAAKYCTTWRAIYDINRDTIGKNPNVVEPGMVLTIAANCIPEEAQNLPADNPIIDKGPMTRATGDYNPPYYTVAWGDTLSSIGVRLGTVWQDIAKANKIEGTIIRAGQILFIPNLPGSAIPPQQGTVERVYFQTGATSAVMVGVISQGAQRSYVLWGAAGQTLTVSTLSSGEPLGISVGNTQGDLLPLAGVNSQVDNNVWSLLPGSTDYVITVRPLAPPENPQLSFTITFSIR